MARYGRVRHNNLNPNGATGADSIAPEAWPITLDGNRAPCLQISSPSADHIATNAPKMQDSRQDEMLDIIAHLTSRYQFSRSPQYNAGAPPGRDCED